MAQLINDLTQGGNYAILPAAIRYDNNLTDSEKLLFCELTALSNKRGYCYASNKYLSGIFNVTLETVSRRINRLKNKGYLHVELIRDGKEIKERHIYPLMDASRGIDANVKRGIDDSINGGIDANVKENTLYNSNNLNNNNLNNNTHSENAIESDFETWWNLYDKKIEKKKAFTRFKACHKKDGFDKIMDGTRSYLKTVDAKKYQKHPTTFLNGDLYLDKEGFDELAKENVSQIKSNQIQGTPNPYAENYQDLPF